MVRKSKIFLLWWDNKPIAPMFWGEHLVGFQGFFTVNISACGISSNAEYALNRIFHPKSQTEQVFSDNDIKRRHLTKLLIINNLQSTYEDPVKIHE